MEWRNRDLVAATTTFLVLPCAFNYDMAVVGLAAAILLFREGKRLHWAGRILALFALGFLWVQAMAYAPGERTEKAPEQLGPGALLVNAGV